MSDCAAGIGSEQAVIYLLRPKVPRAFVFAYQHRFPDLWCGFYVADRCEGT